MNNRFNMQLQKKDHSPVPKTSHSLVSLKFMKYFGNRQRLCTMLFYVSAIALVLYIGKVSLIGWGKLENNKVEFGATKTAIVYAVPNYHMEVASTVSCILSSIGYSVTAFIDNKMSVHWNLFQPITQNWKYDCISLYGQCVSNWMDTSISGSFRNKYEDISTPELIVFVTFPFRIRPWPSILYGSEPIEDPRAMNLLKKYFQNEHRKASEKFPKVVLVTHNVREIAYDSEYIRNIESIVPRKHIHYLLLSEHTKIGAMSKMLESESHRSAGSEPLAVDYFFPIMPTHFIDIIAKEEEEKKKKKNPALLQQQQEQEQQPKGGPFLAIQGSFGGKSSFRRNLTHVMSCLRDLEQRGDVTASLQRLWPARISNNTSSTTSSSSKSTTLALRLVGRINQPFDLQLGRHLQHTEVSFHSDLHPRDFYLSIHQAHFLLAAIDNREYFSLRASSSIPAAFIANVPFVANAELLQLYPCIREMPLHKRLNQLSQCASIAAALAMTTSEYRAAQQELLVCGQQLWGLAQNVFRGIAAAGAGA